MRGLGGVALGKLLRGSRYCDAEYRGGLSRVSNRVVSSTTIEPEHCGAIEIVFACSEFTEELDT
jgi:hypothetical protein